MKKTAEIFAILSLGAFCLEADEVRFVDGRLVRVSENDSRTEPTLSYRIAPTTKWHQSEWEMPASSPQTLESVAYKESQIDVIEGESLSEKLARVGRLKLKELDETSAEPAAPMQEAPTQIAAEPEPIKETPPPALAVASAPIPEFVSDEDIAEFESANAALLKKIKEREALKSVKTVVVEKTSPAPAIVETKKAPAPKFEEPQTQSDIVFDDAARKKADDELRLRLEADMKEAEDSAPMVVAEKLSNYYTYGGECFNVISSNYEAHELGVSVAKTIEEAFSAFFGKGLNFSPKVNLQMLLPEEAKFAGYFQVIKDSSLTISVKCDKDLPLDEFCGLAAAAYLNALAATLKGSYISAPYWLKLGMKAALAQNFAMGVAYDTARFSAANPPDKLGEVISYTKETQKPVKFLEASAYWNLIALKNLSGSAEIFETLMRAILAGEDAGKLLEPLKKHFGEVFDLEMRAIMLGEIHARVGGVKNFEDSDRELIYLLSLQKQREGEPPQIFTGEQIFADREILEREIETRLTEIKLALPWANPVYYNAYVALGKMLVHAANGDFEDFDAAGKDFAFELKKARAAAVRTVQLLNEK